MDKMYGIKQTDFRLTPEFNKWGCNVRSVIRLVEDWEGEEFSAQDIRDITQDAIMDEYVTADMKVKSYVGLSRVAFRKLGNRTSFVMDVGTQRPTSSPTFYGFVEKSGDLSYHYTIGRWKTYNGNDHYVLQSEGGTLLFDPYPEDTRDELVYDILMRVVD